MDINITKKSIIITPPPKRNRKNGLKVYLQRTFDPNDSTLPTATTDLKKGQKKYSIPKGFIYTIKRITF